jgi:hypothetical protein
VSNYPLFVKNKLLSHVQNLADLSWLYVKNPGKDFTRNRKLPFETVIEILLSMGGGTLNQELYEFFNYDVNTASSSAFVQQRDKILPEALKLLHHEFTHSFLGDKTYNGYRLLAVDGTGLSIFHNPNDSDTHFKTQPNSKGYNLLHLTALYDLKNKLYLDACLQAKKKSNEAKAFATMIDRSKLDCKAIVIGDRGLESYNAFAHVEEKGWNYLIRVKEPSSNGILSALDLPSSEEFDQEIQLTLTRKQTKEIKAYPEIYKIMPSVSTFDYLGRHENKFYPISFRAIRVQVAENCYQSFITNLPASEFTADTIKELYHLRWGIETSFRELKYAIGLTNFHAKKVAYIAQEVFARLTMYNFCEIITLQVMIRQKPQKHGYQVNFTMAIQICLYFFKCYRHARPPNVEALIQKHILPIRKDRKYPRKIRFQSAVSFNYRVN